MTETMSEKKRKRPQTNAEAIAKTRSGKKNINVWVDASLRDALDALMAKTRRDLTAEVSVALEFYLGREGLWPVEQE